MTLDRRTLLKHAGAVSLAGLGASLAHVADVQAADYKALVVVFLSGGHDGNNLLVPMDGAYNDYAKARPSLALAKDSLVPLSGTHIGHKFGLSGASRGLSTLFEQQRLAIVANVGALIQPTTLTQLRDRTAKLPPFLGSHTEQEQWIQGWMGDEDLSGWGGRAMDVMPPSMKHKQPLIALARDYTAVLGNNTPISLANSNGSSNWGRANLQNTNDLTQKRLEWLSRMQSNNAFEAEFSRSMRVAYLDSLEFANGQQSVAEPTGMFPNMQIGKDLRFAAKHIAYSKRAGARRQVYLVQDGGYDTHTGQLSTDPGTPGLESLFNDVTSSLVGFDQSMRSLGMQDEVVTIVLSEFGRTLDPAAGAGSDHGWGNHWYVMGGPVKGGRIYGDDFPTLQTGGPDDASLYDPKRGQWLPQFSSDQFIADTLLWMGLSPAQVLTVLPNLAKFKNHKIGYL
jgi:uncharacterized protein (DUF1501 family)